MYKGSYKSYPLPKGNSYYAQAKRAEYIRKDIPLAKSLLQRAIATGDRAESAIKDLASIHHQEGLTSVACSLLLSHEWLFEDKEKFRNLLSSLRSKLQPTKNSHLKQLKILNVSHSVDFSYIEGLFRDSSRILSIVPSPPHCLVSFHSHSAARKTLSSYSGWKQHKVIWDDTDPGIESFLLGKSLLLELKSPSF